MKIRERDLFLEEDERRERRRSKRRERSQRKCCLCNVKIRSGDICPDCRKWEN